MKKNIQSFIRGIQGMPFGEMIMPGYVFADKERRGTTSIEYRMEARGGKWWYERSIKITRPNATDEFYSQWFGSYDSQAECEKRIERAKKLDGEFSPA